jgi:hypothetical protein
MNDDPSVPFQPLNGIEDAKIAIVVESGIRVVSRIPALEWAKELKFFREANPSLPRKPNPPPTEFTNPLTNYKGKW